VFYLLYDDLLILFCLFFEMLEERGVTFYMNDAVAEIQGENRRVMSTCFFLNNISPFHWRLIN